MLQAHGTFALVGASQDGRTAVLARTQTRSTTFVLVTQHGGERQVQRPGHWQFDALSGRRLSLSHGSTSEMRRGTVSSVSGRYRCTLVAVSGDGDAVEVLDTVRGRRTTVRLPGSGSADAAMTYVLVPDVDDRQLWAVSPGYGRIARIDLATAASRFVRVSAGPLERRSGGWCAGPRRRAHRVLRRTARLARGACDTARDPRAAATRRRRSAGRPTRAVCGLSANEAASARCGSGSADDRGFGRRRDLAHDLDDVAVRVPDAQLTVGAVAAREDLADPFELALASRARARAARGRAASGGRAARSARGCGGRSRDPSPAPRARSARRATCSPSSGSGGSSGSRGPPRTCSQ